MVPATSPLSLKTCKTRADRRDDRISFQTRFTGEAGRHELIEKNARHVCLIEAASPPLNKYQPPEGIERKGGIAARGGGLCRTYDRGEAKVLEANRRIPWPPADLGGVIATLTEERLEALITAATS